MLITNEKIMDCRQCIWGQSVPPVTPCSNSLSGACALKRLVSGTKIDQGSLTTAHIGGFKLTTALQPIFSLSHERIVAYEALIRGINGKQTLSPWEIFSSAVSFEQTVQLDRLCRTIHLHNYQRYIDHEAWLFLNINPQVIAGGRTYGAFFQALLNSTGVPPERIVIEILEHAIDDEQLLTETVHYYREMGCLIALDDFGSGHSNFERILRLKPDIVKLDCTMVRQANDSEIARRILPNLIAMLHEAGCLVLMEGVETEEEALIALESNADFVQGFYFAKPTAPHKIKADQGTKFHLLNGLHKTRFEQNSHRREQALLGYKQCLTQSAASYAAGAEPYAAYRRLLTMPRVQRCYLLDGEGSQLGDNLYPENRAMKHNRRFRPLADTQGANWSRKPYFRKAVIHPGKVKVSRPYLSLTGAEMCITLSICIERGGERRILCCDLNDKDTAATLNGESRITAFAARLPPHPVSLFPLTARSK